MVASIAAQNQHHVYIPTITTGNGTSDIFEHDPSVLFVSTHQQGIYPFQGKLTDVGKGDGEGLTMHIPLPGTFDWCCTICGQ